MDKQMKRLVFRQKLKLQLLEIILIKIWKKHREESGLLMIKDTLKQKSLLKKLVI